ncbi:tetratricopeptide repeat protein, partial [Aeromonas veronii]
MNIKPLLLALAIGVVPLASSAKDWSKEPLVAVQQAAEQGLAVAQLNLGVRYATGRGVAQDDKQALAWTRKAAEQGHADAQFNLGVMYATGRGVAQDASQAVAWYHKAAAQGHADAQ